MWLKLFNIVYFLTYMQTCILLLIILDSSGLLDSQHMHLAFLVMLKGTNAMLLDLVFPLLL